MSNYLKSVLKIFLEWIIWATLKCSYRYVGMRFVLKGANADPASRNFVLLPLLWVIRVRRCFFFSFPWAAVYSKLSWPVIAVVIERERVNYSSGSVSLGDSSRQMNWGILDLPWLWVWIVVDIGQLVFVQYQDQTSFKARPKGVRYRRIGRSVNIAENSFAV